MENLARKRVRLKKSLVLFLLLLQLAITKCDVMRDKDVKRDDNPIPLNRRCLLNGEPGWKCNDGQCNQMSWTCDGYEQCPDSGDDSDEKEGCNLFPEEGCNSWHGKRHFKCPNSTQCVQNLSECPSKPQNNENNNGDEPSQNLDSNSNGCPDPENQWRCQDGFCIAKDQVCNRKKNCQDGSDETVGCSLFGYTECTSWGGLEHVHCNNKNSTDLCTLPIFKDGNCRLCSDSEILNRQNPYGNVTFWRCDDGYCIPDSKVQDGLYDCPDGSDETGVRIKWWVPFTIIIVIAFIGIISSFLHRISAVEKMFDCTFCRSTKSSALKDAKYESKKPTMKAAKNQDETKFSQIVNMDETAFSEIDLADTSVSNPNLQRTNFVYERAMSYAEIALPMELIKVLEEGIPHFTDSFFMQRDKRNEAHHLYAKVHQKPEEYRYLYRYLVYRMAKPENLKHTIDLLFEFEKSFHCNLNERALACWRIHLGSCQELDLLIDCVQEPSLMARFKNFYQPAKDTLRKFRRDSKLNKWIRMILDGIYNLWNLGLYMIKPFIGISFLYFDIAKDIILVTFIFQSLIEIAKDEVTLRAFPFEVTLVAFLITAMILCQIAFIIISVKYSPKIFDHCDHKEKRSKVIMYRILSGLCAPFMPAFILANHVYYLQREYVAKRKLQCDDWLEENEEKNETHEYKLRQIKENPKYLDRFSSQLEYDQFRWKAFKIIERCRYKSRLYRRIYSFYRVSAAVLQSFNTLVVVITVFLVNSRPGGHLPLINSIAQKLGDFFNIAPTDFDDPGLYSLIGNLATLKDTVLLFCAAYSFTIIISALFRYVVVTKNALFILGGRIFFGLYLSFMTISRLTMYIAMFVTSASSKNVTNGKDVISDPAITFIPMGIIGVSIWICHLIVIYYFYTMRVPQFLKVPWIVRVVHCLANSVVALPFATWDVSDASKVLRRPLPKRTHSVPSSRSVTPNLKNFRGQSPSSTLALSNGKPQSNFKKTHKRAQSSTVHRFPDITQPFVMNFLKIEDLPQKICNLWWENPRRELTVDDAVDKLSDDVEKLSNGNDEIMENVTKEIRKVHKEMEEGGFINKTDLYHPQKTKREFFWLLAFHAIFSSIALILEIANGGTTVTSGVYYSWDVRIATFFMGLIFLALYYRRYHRRRDLMAISCGTLFKECLPAACLNKEEEPLKAECNEEDMSRFLSRSFLLRDSESQGNTREMQTQTSLIEPKCVNCTSLSEEKKKSSKK